MPRRGCLWFACLQSAFVRVCFQASIPCLAVFSMSVTILCFAVFRVAGCFPCHVAKIERKVCLGLAKRQDWDK